VRKAALEQQKVGYDLFWAGKFSPILKYTKSRVIDAINN